MKTIILEGASTSGKTVIKEKLVGLMTQNKIKYRVLEEDKTLIPYLDNPDLNTSIKAMHDFLNELSLEKKDIVIIDRLYFTHVLINNSNLEKFKNVENELMSFNPLIIFLQIDENKILERVKKAFEHRDNTWKEHVLSKGDDRQIEEWYIRTQVKLEGLYNETTLPKISYNTTEMDFDRIAKEIFEKYIKSCF